MPGASSQRASRASAAAMPMSESESESEADAARPTLVAISIRDTAAGSGVVSFSMCTKCVSVVHKGTRSAGRPAKPSRSRASTASVCSASNNAAYDGVSRQATGVIQASQTSERRPIRPRTPPGVRARTLDRPRGVGAQQLGVQRRDERALGVVRERERERVGVHGHERRQGLVPLGGATRAHDAE